MFLMLPSEWGRQGRNHFVIRQSILFLNKACPQGESVNQSRTTCWGVIRALLIWERANSQPQPTLTLTILSSLRRRRTPWETFVKFPVQRQRLTKTLRPNHKIVEGFPFSSTSPLDDSRPIYSTSFYTHIIQTLKKKITRYTKKGKKYNLKSQSKHQNQAR